MPAILARRLDAFILLPSLARVRLKRSRYRVNGGLHDSGSFSTGRGATAIDLGVETLDEEVDREPQLEHDAGDRRLYADVDPEDLGDHAGHQDRVADQARNREPSRDEPRPEEQCAEEDGPESKRCLGDVVGHEVRLPEK